MTDRPDSNAAHVRVKGVCPRGCGSTLFVGSGGHVTCSYTACPDPSAADLLLQKGERMWRAWQAIRNV